MLSTINDNLNVLKSDVDSCFQSVSNGKALLASTLTGLGVTTASDATFATINTNITTLANNKYNSGYSAGAASVDTSGTATEADIVKDKTAVVNGRRLTGTLDTQTYYNNGYTAGVASVDTQSYYNNGYADGQNASRCMVTIPGQQLTGSSASAGNKTVTLTVSSLSGFTHMDQPVTRGTSGTTEAAIQVNTIVIKDAAGNTIKTEECVNGGKRSNNIIDVTDRGVIDITGAASIEITVTRKHAGSYGNAWGIDISSFNLYNYEVQPTTRPSIPEVWIS